MRIQEEKELLRKMMEDFGRDFAIKTMVGAYQTILNELADIIEEDTKTDKQVSV